MDRVWAIGKATGNLEATKSLRRGNTIPPFWYDGAMNCERYVTYEHEAAHVVVARAGGAIIQYVDLSFSFLTAETGSLAYSAWKPPQGDVNCMVAGFAAGPGQTQIVVWRDSLDQSIAEEAITLEGEAFARVMNGLPDAGRQLMRIYVPQIIPYLKEPAVQVAIAQIAEALKLCESHQIKYIPWSDLKDLVDWSALPPLPSVK